MAELLKIFQEHGPSFGLTLNLKKREVFWPSGDPGFSDFPPEVSRPLQVSDGVQLLQRCRHQDTTTKRIRQKEHQWSP